MACDGRSIYVSIGGRVELIEPKALSLAELRAAVSARFGVGARLRFVSDESGTPEVATDEHLARLAQGGPQKRVHTLRALPTLEDLAEWPSLELRAGQLRLLQWEVLRDEVSHVQSEQQGLQAEVRQLRSLLEQATHREVDLTTELMGDRQRREQVEQSLAQQIEALTNDIRREHHAAEGREAVLRREVEELRALAARHADASEQQQRSMNAAVAAEASDRGKAVNAVLARWASGQAETQKMLDELRSHVKRCAEDAEVHAKGLLQESSAREAFERFVDEKLRALEQSISCIPLARDVARLAGAAKQAQAAATTLSDVASHRHAMPHDPSKTSGACAAWLGSDLHVVAAGQ